MTLTLILAGAQIWSLTETRGLWPDLLSGFDLNLAGTLSFFEFRLALELAWVHTTTSTYNMVTQYIMQRVRTREGRALVYHRGPTFIPEYRVTHGCTVILYLILLFVFLFNLIYY